ncbi:MAG TPA: thiamine pyrophosphate-dependent enzyme [Stellaceae bacterium]|nr:thiamine pyrophosphate-dependent enzyme [Stellaceae bacterium]
MAEAEARLLERRAVVAKLLAERGDTLVVAGLGSAAWDVTAAGDHPLNFPMWGAMGGAVAFALGLALAQPQRRTLVLSGDGDLLMGLGSLATVAVQRPANLAIVALDNERYGETGMQETATAAGIDLAGIAAACGFPVAATVRDERQLAAAIPQIRSVPGPVFVAIKIRAETLPLVLPPKDGTLLKLRFRQALLGPQAG